jgi:hypothetical protein
MKILHAILVLFLVSLAAIPAIADGPLKIRVSPAVSFAPANVIVRTTVERDAANRAMEIVADSPRYYRSSEIQLDGDKAPRTTTVEFRSLPSGTYEVTARLFDAQGRARATVSQQVNVVASGSNRGQ